MKIIITGASGRIGRALVEYLLRHTDFSLVMNYRQESSVPRIVSSSRRCDIVTGDIEEPGTIASVFATQAPVLIHLASDINRAGEGGSWYNSLVNQTKSSMNIIDYLKNYQHPCHVIFPSSGGTVYYGNQHTPYRENDPVTGCSPYGIHKILIENYLKLLTSYNSNITCNVLRISNPYGMDAESKKKQGFIDILIDRVKNNLPIDIWSSLDTVRDYIYIEDLNEAILKSVHYIDGFHIFNIGSGVGSSLSEVINCVEKTSGKKISLINNWDGKDSFYPLYNVLDISKAEHVLHWTPKYNLISGISTILQ